MVRSPLVS